MSMERRSVSQSRRSFLKALGTGLATLPFYSMLEDHFVRAQTGELPLRFMGFGFYHGTAGQLYARRPGETDTQYTLDYPHSPFKPFDDAATYGVSFKDRVAICEGFDFAVGRFRPNGEEHEVPMHGAMGLLLTGSAMLQAGLANASIDQYLAARHGGRTRFRSVQMRALDHYGLAMDSAFCISFDASGRALTPLHNPLEIWDKFFAQSITSGDARALAEARQQRASGKSVLDFVTRDLERMRTRLSSEEKAKLDQHLTVVRGLELRLDQAGAAACRVPPRRDQPGDDYRFDASENGNVLKVTDYNLELLAEIVACGLTHFATFQLPMETGPTPEVIEMEDLRDGGMLRVADGTQDTDFPVYFDFHGRCAHRLRDDGTDLAVLSQRMVAAVNRFYFSRIARVMQRLNEAGVLDGTLIMAGSDGGHGAHHTTRDVPILLAGGGNGALKLGRRVVAPGRRARALDVCEDGPLSSHNAILVAIANAFGEDITSYGTGLPEHTQGVSWLFS